MRECVEWFNLTVHNSYAIDRMAVKNPSLQSPFKIFKNIPQNGLMDSTAVLIFFFFKREGIQGRPTFSYSPHFEPIPG